MTKTQLMKIIKEELENTMKLSKTVAKDMMKQLESIKTSYEGAEWMQNAPPAIEELNSLIRTPGLAGTREFHRGIARIWNNLLTWHETESSRIPSDVPGHLNAIASLSRKAE